MGLVKYYTYGLPSFLVVVIALYLLFRGKDDDVIIPKLDLMCLRIQILARRSMLADSWKRQVLTLGLQLVLACVLA